MAGGREPEELTNSILVSPLNVFISTLTILVPEPHCSEIQPEVLVKAPHPDGLYIGSAFSSGTLLFLALNRSLVRGCWQYGPWLELHILQKPPLMFCQGMCMKASTLHSHTVRNVYRQQYPSWGFCSWVGRGDWVRAKLLPLSICLPGTGLRGLEFRCSPSQGWVTVSLCVAYRQSVEN